MSIRIADKVIAISGKDYYTKQEIDEQLKDLNTVLESLIGTGTIDLSSIDTINGEVI